MSAPDPGPLLADIAQEAARLVMAYWRTPLTVALKADASPVTLADRQAEQLILRRLTAHFPGVPVVSEEDAAEFGTPQAVGRRFFLVDPIDGTKAFVRGEASFTVNIALIEDGAPRAGAVVAPALSETWMTREGRAWKQGLSGGEFAAIHVRPRPVQPLALVSHSLRPDQAAELARLHGFDQWRPLDSSLKLCRVAEGAADLYPRHGPTMEWDIAAGHAVLAAAGGALTGLDGSDFGYGKATEGFLNLGFVARGGEGG
ncbi:MAG: cysQ [Caulobacteraceae bacterium]|nr:cysQ [Caulobacteraceae bacterium]